MKKLTIISLALLMFIGSVSFVSASTSTEKYDSTFFNQHIKNVIIEELKSNGISVLEDLSIDELMTLTNNSASDCLL